MQLVVLVLGEESPKKDAFVRGHVVVDQLARIGGRRREKLIAWLSFFLFSNFGFVMKYKYKPDHHRPGKVEPLAGWEERRNQRPPTQLEPALGGVCKAGRRSGGDKGGLGNR